MTAPTAMTSHNEPLPVHFTAPWQNPAARGLFAATGWVEEIGALRWLASGVEIKPTNTGAADSCGVWGADWCAQPGDLTPDDIKEGTRPEPLAPFAAITTWAYDGCDLTADSRPEVRERAEAVHRLREPLLVEREFSARLIADAGIADTAPDIVTALAAVDVLIAAQNIPAVIHASPRWIAPAAAANLLVRGSAPMFTTPSGARWVFGGGYIDSLDDTLIVTTPTYGWRGPLEIRDAVDASGGTFATVAERSVVVAYEASLGAVQIVPPTP